MTLSLQTSIECVLFDLDGTLIDTAPDFVKSVNELLREQGEKPIAEKKIFQTVSDGARALVKLAFNIDENHSDFIRLNQRLLDIYYAQLNTTEAKLYPGLELLLQQFEDQNIKWGIVTNKPEKYSELLLTKMNLRDRCHALVCPDHVTNTKPHPEPILLACQLLNCNTERTIYIGDHIRDIQAAKNADVIAVAAAYGYLSEDAKVEEWCADFIIHSSDQTTHLLNLLKFA